MRLKNLTPHPVNIVCGTARLTLPPDTLSPPRIAETVTPVGSVGLQGFDIPLAHVHASTVSGLPPAEPETLLIVARIIAEAHPDRGDLVVPYNVIRDPQGAVIGCTSLARIITDQNRATPR